MKTRFQVAGKDKGGTRSFHGKFIVDIQSFVFVVQYMIGQIDNLHILNLVVQCIITAWYFPTTKIIVYLIK
jgi:hypothetical protein